MYSRNNFFFGHLPIATPRILRAPAKLSCRNSNWANINQIKAKVN